MFRATVKRSIPHPRGGIALIIDIAEGSVKPGDVLRVALPTQAVEVKVRGVEFLDHDIGRPTFHADVAIVSMGCSRVTCRSGRWSPSQMTERELR